jgi:primosomal protein N' (replication factor Y)
MTPQILFTEVLLPLPVKGTFTYRVPAADMAAVQKGVRVAVQFGRKKIYTGLVVDIHSNIPQTYQPKYLLSVVDEEPLVNQQQLTFWKWIAGYYMAFEGEVMNAAMPSALKLAGETQVIMHPEYDKNYDTLNEREYLVAEALESQDALTLTEVADIIDQRKVMPLIKTLIEKRVVLLKEEIEEAYKPRVVRWVTLSDAYRDEEKMGALFDELEKRAYKQLEILMTFIKLSDYYNEDAKKAVKQSILLKQANGSSAQIKALKEKGIIETFDREERRLASYAAKSTPGEIELTPGQQKALNSIHDYFRNNKTTLLHGITGSGKTEIYIKLIAETIAAGKEVLYLLPEIALTTQTINRLRKYFGDLVGVYHSRYNPYERVEIWNEVLKHDLSEKKRYQIILGARSALFLPYDNLGLVIVDEEHDSSYKQHDPAPRYNGRDAAIYLASMHGAQVILGTATPSLETYYNTQNNKYGLVELSERYGGMLLPEINIANLKIEKRRKQMRAMFSSLLIENMEEAMQNNEQIILFQNRRGFSLRVECEVCSWVPQCKNCDVSMIYHKKSNLLKCHYCGFSETVPERCPSCGSHDIFMHGFGTEQVEEELSLMYPNHRIKRMDLDTTRSKHGHQKIITDFSDKKIDILVGTQMVTKGLDFENVRVVGILNADTFLNFPDFRAFERGFQLMAQVSGRAGRKNNRGKVIIQTHNPDHSAIRYVINNDYEAMYLLQIAERKKFHYPPFYRIVKVEMKHKDWKILNTGAAQLSSMLRKKFGKAVLGPEYPIIPRIRNFYLKNIMIKIPSDKRLHENKHSLAQIIDAYKDGSAYKSIRININVDPV